MTLEELYNKNYKLMYWYVSKMIDDWDKNDIIHDVFVKLKSKYPNFDMGEKEAMGIAFITLKNTCLNFYKKRKVREKYIKHVDYYSPLEFDETKIEFDTLNIIMDIIKKLDPKYRKCIELFYFEEKTSKQISIELNIPDSTVRTNLKIARDLLKQHFKYLEL